MKRLPLLTRRDYGSIALILLATALAGALLGVIFANLGAASW